MLTRRHGYALIFGTVCGSLSVPARAQSQTATASIDAEDTEPGRPRQRRRAEDFHEHTGGGGGAGGVSHSDGEDHESVVGHFGVGWFGVSNILVQFALDGSTTGGVVAAPVLGVRYWLSETIGIDGGLGIAISGSSASVEAAGTTTANDGPSTFGLLLHGGLPIAMKTGRHYTFTLVPEINIGFASITRQIANPPAPNMQIDNTGFRFDLGGRAGAEVHFGFIGIPELALEASVGIFLTRIQARAEQGGVVQRVGQTSITTTSLNNPWDFFRTAVAARYYF